MTPAERIRACVDQALREGQAAAEIEDGQVPTIAFGVVKVQQYCSLGYDLSGMFEPAQGLDPQRRPSSPSNHDFWVSGCSQKLD
jgi:hypothetical protein